MEIGLFLAGCLTFPLLHQLSMQALSSFLLPGKSKSLHLSLSTRVVSLIQAVCASCVGLQVILTCQDIMRDRYLSVYNYAWFGLSYFYYDIGAMFLETYYSSPTEPFMTKFWRFMSKKLLVVLHHFFLPIIGFPIIMFLRRGIGDFFVGCFYMAEISTPFLSLNTILKKLELKDSMAYKVNGVLLIITYFCGRILIFPFMYWSYARYSTQQIWSVPFRIPFFCNLSCLALLSLQTVWFGAILEQMLTFFKYDKRSESESTVLGQDDNMAFACSANGVPRFHDNKNKLF